LEIYEPGGSILNPDTYGVYIGDEQTVRRTIAGNTPTSLVIGYTTGVSYAVKQLYPKVEMMINGHDVVFQDVPGVSANPSGNAFVKYPMYGLRVECVGIKGYANYVEAEYIVTVENADTRIYIGYGNSWDSDRFEIHEPGGSSLWPDSDTNFYINGTQQMSHSILKNTSTSLVVRCPVGTGYALQASYPRVELMINGHDVLFQNVPASAN
jgi:hypothetical protein